ncbi:MAG: ATP-binding protein [Spirochaetes bacterium]|nr:ATP-binding protein [Spirochaetota bacterium]
MKALSLYIMTSCVLVMSAPSYLNAFAAVTLDERLALKNISGAVDYLEDPEKKLAFNAVKNDASLAWKAHGGDYINFGYTRSRYWFRFAADNRVNRKLTWLLEIDDPLIDFIELYVPDDYGRYVARETGDHLPFDSRDLREVTFIYKIDQQPGTSVYYLRIDSLDAVNFSLNMLSYDSYVDRLHNDLPIYWIFFGLMLVMAVYNLFFFISSRELGYFYLSCFIIAYAMFEFSFKGLAFQYLWPNATWWASRASPFFACGIIVWVSVFLFDFVQQQRTYRYYKPIRNAILMVVVVSLLLAAFSLFGDIQLALLLIFVFAIGNVIVEVVVGIFLGFFYRPRSRQARIGLLAFSVFAVSVPITILSLTGDLPWNLYTRWSLQVGTSVAVVLLSFGITDKINTMKNIIRVGEKRYRHLVESTNDIIFTLDEKNKILGINSAVKRHLGFRVDDLVSKSFLDLIEEPSPKKSDIARQIVLDYIDDLKKNRKKRVQFNASMIDKYSHEPKEFTISLEYTGGGDTGYAVLGKASPVIDDALAPFLVTEHFFYSVNNYLGNAELMSQRLVRSLHSLAPLPVVTDMRVALREAIINAIEHGNLRLTFEEKTRLQITGKYFDLIKERQMDPLCNRRKVCVEYSLSEERVIYTISDEGDGFDHRAMLKAEPGNPASLELEHGRGLMMIKDAFDAVTYNEKGNSMTLVKYLKKSG